ncbi:glycosyltransferase family 2 protein [Candidatus Woesebacteria bacterium]|nr:MAG: glycosyltransferase family 2 protein [Candidatus Woesebacteria bacterium]
MKDLSIIIVSYNTCDLTLECIQSVIKFTKSIRYEIIVVDNNSKDSSVKMLSKLHESGKITLIGNKSNLGFAAANNIGISKTSGRFVLFLNSDTVLDDNVLGEMVAWMDKHPKIGIASCALKNIDGSMQGTGGYFPTLSRVMSWMTIQDIPGVDKFIKPFHPMKEKSFTPSLDFYNHPKELDWITGAFMLVRRQVVDDVGLFDEKYFMYTEETDYCYRAQKRGWQIYYNPKWSIVHIGGASGTKESSINKEFNGVKRFYLKYYPKWNYPVLILLLKIGTFGRCVLFTLMNRKEEAKIYAQAFRTV